MKKRLSRRFYFILGYAFGGWLFGAAWGFTQDMMGMDRWMEFERTHWLPASQTMPA